MAKELAFALMNPYPIRKSRTGGIIARYLVRTDLKLVGARIIGASQKLVDELSAYLTTYDLTDPEKCALFSGYIRKEYAPDPVTGHPHRSMLLLFEGEDAIRKTFEVTGSIRQRWLSGLTIRDTFGDMIRNPVTNEVEYFEPSVVVGATKEVVGNILRILAKYLQADAGIVRGAIDFQPGDDIQQTLVMLKPDNWRQPSLRAGNILDLISGTGLRIVGVKKFAMSVAQAEKFYGPVRESLKGVFKRFGAQRAAQALSHEFGFPVDAANLTDLCDHLAPLFAAREFESIVEFMTGHRPSNCTPEERAKPGTEECLAVVYEGADAVHKIRDILGATDPNKARPGSIRREFGTSIMVNAAHASDSPENARREMKILDVANDPFVENLIRSYYPAP
ncbi:MAG: nucleoside-diphosphate kinase [Kiritimatiellaeota bacterium]|nr:nucleoside-diphosphate kinase [Kiritimatiellota bacterium]